jgi:hypothetical protein
LRNKDAEALLGSNYLFVARAKTKAAEGFATFNFFIFTNLQLLKGFDSGTHRIYRIVVTQRFTQDIFQARRFQHCPNTTARDDTRTGRGGAQYYFTRTKTGGNFVGNSAVINQWDFDQVLLGIITALANRVGYFSGLT